MSVVVLVLTLAAFLISLGYEFKSYIEIYRYFVMVVSLFSVNLVTMLFINLAAVLKRCFTRINTCLCELIKGMGEGSVGLYRQVSVVKDPQPLIKVNYKCDKSKRKIVHIRLGCDYVFDFVFFSTPFFHSHTCFSYVLLRLYIILTMALLIL
jgi:hypothetical protein